MGTAEARPYLDEGERSLERGDYAAAERAFAQAAQAAPDSALAHSKFGVALAHQRKLDAAIGEFSKAVAMDPGYAAAYNNLGNAYREKGMPDEALVAYERAIAIDPDYWVAHQNLGVLYKEMGRLSEAVEHFKKATRLSTREPGKTGGRRLGCLGAGLVGLALILAMWILA